MSILNVLGRRGPQWAKAFFISAIVLMINGAAGCKAVASSRIAANAPLITKLSSVPMGVLEHVVVFNPAPRIKMKGARTDRIKIFQCYLDSYGILLPSWRYQNWDAPLPIVRKVKIFREQIRNQRQIKVRPQVTSRCFSAVVPLNNDGPILDLIGHRILLAYPHVVAWEYERAVSINQSVTAKLHLIAGGLSRPPCEAQGRQNGSKSERTEAALKFGPPNSVLSGFRHAPLFMQVGLLIACGGCAFYLWIVGLGLFLYGNKSGLKWTGIWQHPKIAGVCAVAVGFFIWFLGIGLCFLFAG